MSTTPLGTTTVTQIGIVVRNLEESAAAWSRLLGVAMPKMIVTEPADLSRVQYHGQTTPALARLALFQLGQVTLELIEPVGEPSTWNDQLLSHGQGLHHIAFQVKGLAERLAPLVAYGLPVVQRGEFPGGRYAYLDGQQHYGAIVELLEND